MEEKKKDSPVKNPVPAAHWNQVFRKYRKAHAITSSLEEAKGEAPPGSRPALHLRGSCSSENGRQASGLPLHGRSFPNPGRRPLEELGSSPQESGAKLQQLKDTLPVSRVGINRCFFPFFQTTVREAKKPTFIGTLLCAVLLPHAHFLNRKRSVSSKRENWNGRRRRRP